MQNKETKKIGLAPKRQKGYLAYIIITILLVALIVGLATLFFRDYSKVEYADAKIGGKSFRLEVASTETARQKGLSERDGLPEGQGMLFKFEQNGDWRIWMVQMRFSIDVIWLDENKKIVHIKQNATPAEYPEVYKADEPSRYIIELRSGVSGTLGLKQGDEVTF